MPISETHEYIYVGEGDSYPPLASFTVSREVGVLPLTVTFTDTTEDPVTSRQWLINGVEVSTEPTFNYTFSEDGRYTVTLIVTNNYGSSSAQRDILVYSPYSTRYSVYRDPSFLQTIYNAFYLQNENKVYIYKITTDPVFENSFSYNGQAKAIGISVGDDHNIVYLLIGNTVYGYNFDGSLYTSFQITGTEAFSLDADRNAIYITEGNVLRKYSLTGELLQTLTSAEEIPFSNLTGIAVVQEEERRLFVMDSNNGRLIAIDRPSLQPIFTFGTYGTAESPQDISHYKDALHLYILYSDNKHLWVNDAGNNRIIGLSLNWFDSQNYTFLAYSSILESYGLLESSITIEVLFSMSATSHTESPPALTSASISIPIKITASGKLLKSEGSIFLQSGYSITASGYGGITGRALVDISYFLESIGYSTRIASSSISIYPELIISGILGSRGTCRVTLPFSLQGSLTIAQSPRQQTNTTTIIIHPSINVSAEPIIPFGVRHGSARLTPQYQLSINGLNLVPRTGAATLNLSYKTQITHVRHYGEARINISVRIQTGTPVRTGSVRLPIVFNLNAVSNTVYGRSSIKSPLINITSAGLIGITGGISYNLRITITIDGEVLHIEPSGAIIVVTLFNKAVTRYESYPYTQVTEALGTSYGILNGELYILSDQNDTEQARFDLLTYDITEIHEAIPDSIYLLYDRKVDVTASVNNHQYNALGYPNGKTRVILGKGFTDVLYDISIETYNDFSLNRIDLDMKDRTLRRV